MSSVKCTVEFCNKIERTLLFRSNIFE